MEGSKFAPSVAVLHTVTSRLARSLHDVYGIFTPQLNAAPVLWRVVGRMGGNRMSNPADFAKLLVNRHILITVVAVLFDISKILAGYLDIPLTLHASLAPGMVQRRRRTPGMHKGDNVPTEVSLAATVTICLKLIYGELAGNET